MSKLIEPRYSWPKNHIINISSGSFHPTESFYDPISKNNLFFTHRSFWRLAAYITNICEEKSPKKRESTSPQKPLIIYGPKGAGKTYSLSAISNFLRQKRLSEKYKVIYIGDISRIKFQKPADILAYFSFEILQSLKNSLNPELEQLRNTIPFGYDEFENWVISFSNWLVKNETCLIFIIDQAHLLLDIEARSDIIFIINSFFKKCKSRIVPVFSFSTVSFDNSRRNKFEVFIQENFNICDPSIFEYPSFLQPSEIDRYLEFCSMRFNFTEKKLFNQGNPNKFANRLPKETLLHIGSTFSELSSFFKNFMNASNKDIFSKLEQYSKFCHDDCLKSIQKSNITNNSKMLLSLLFCRALLKIPIRLEISGKREFFINREEVECLPQEILSLFSPNMTQKFYHPVDSYILLSMIPSFKNLSLQKQICDSISCWSLLLGANLSDLLKNHTSAILSLKSICQESKRKCIRYYLEFLINSYFCFPVTLKGTGEYGRLIEITLERDSIVTYFSGIIPSKELVAWVYLQSIGGPDSLNIGSGQEHKSIILIPGRSDYCFFDFFLIPKGHKRLYAISTLQGSSQWSSISNGKVEVDKGSISPYSLLEMWSRIFREMGISKISIQSIYLSPSDLSNDLNLN